MNNYVKYILTFLGGAAIGSGVTYLIMKKKRDKATIEVEIEPCEATEEFSEDYEIEEPEVIKHEEYVSALKKEYEDLIKNNEYKGYSQQEIVFPYIIEDNQYGDNNYDTACLTLYADGILADDRNEPIDDINETVGVKNITTLKNSDNDEIFVRNDNRKCDYEIIKESISFAESE